MIDDAGRNTHNSHTKYKLFGGSSIILKNMKRSHVKKKLEIYCWRGRSEPLKPTDHLAQVVWEPLVCLCLMNCSFSVSLPGEKTCSRPCSSDHTALGKNLCILLQVNHDRNIAYKLKLNIMAHLWEPCLLGHECGAKILWFSSQEIS